MSKSAEIEVVKKIYEYLNAGNIPAIMNFFDPEIVRVEFEGTPAAGTFRGLDEMKVHFNQGRSKWAEGGCYPEKFIAEGNKVIVSVHVKVRLKAKIEWNEGQIGDVFTFSNGKVTHMQSFLTVEEALKSVGLKK